MRAMGVSQMVLMAVEKPSSSCVIPDAAQGCRSESMKDLYWEVLESNCCTRGWGWWGYCSTASGPCTSSCQARLNPGEPGQPPGSPTSLTVSW